MRKGGGGRGVNQSKISHLRNMFFKDIKSVRNPEYITFEKERERVRWCMRVCVKEREREKL